MSLYEVVLYLHILGFAVWFGAILTGTIVWRRRIAAAPDRLVEATDDWRSVDRFLSEPSAVVVLLAGGYLMTAGGFDFAEAIWIHVGFGALMASVAVSILGVGLARRGITKGAGDRLVARATWSAAGAAALILVGLWAMVAKPTF